MKKIFLLPLLLCCLIANVYAQIASPMPRCRTASPGGSYAEQIQRFIAANPRPTAGESVTIPLVFHVFKNAGFTMGYDGYLKSLNMEWQAAKIIAQINESFNKQSPYLKYTPKAFTDVAGSAGINFCLAQRDQEDKATTGVVYHQEMYNYSEDDIYGSTGYGGQLDQYVWDTEKYINIFILPSRKTSIFGGITQWGKGKIPIWHPDANTELYKGCKSKILVDVSTPLCDPEYYKSMEYEGTPGFTAAELKEFKNKKFSVRKYVGQIITHELGHYLGLPHIFNSNCTDDGFKDTPLQHSVVTDVIVKFPYINLCDPQEKNGIMFCNMMDAYLFRSMFTKEQCTFMQSFLASKYPNLSKSDGCILGDCVPDQFEPNETLETAKLIKTNTSYLANLCKGDNDYYKITLDKTQNLKVRLLSLPADLSLAISYEKDGEFILDESDNDGDAEEILIANDVKAQTVYVQVFSKKGLFHPLSTYMLAISSSPIPYGMQQTNNIDELTSKSSAINPNPSNGQINISFGKNFKPGSIVKMTISDMYGNKKLEKQITVTADRLPLDVSNLRDDIYLVNLTGQNVNETHRLVIKK